MVIQFWILTGLVVGGLVSMMLGRHTGIAGNIILGIIGGLAGGFLAAILFLVSDGMNEDHLIAAVIAFTCAAILHMLKRIVAIRPRTA